MYKITLHFQSSDKYLSSTEIMTERDLKSIESDRAYLIAKWYNHLCRIQSITEPDNYDTDEKLKFIRKHLFQSNEENKERIIKGEKTTSTFTITITKEEETNIY